MIKLLSFPVVSISLFFSAQLWAATDCSREAISYYLEKGFTVEQVSRMCQASSVDVPAAASETLQVEQAAAKEVNPADSIDNDEQIFFNKTIISDSLSVTPQTLTYVRDQCIKYGEEDTITGFRSKVCGVIKTSINRVGLKVLRVVNGASIFRDAELLVEGQIQREVVNLDSLSSADRKTFEKILEPSPTTFNIETREDSDPQKVAVRLPR